MFGGNGQLHPSSLHGVNSNGASSFYSENFGQQQNRHQLDDMFSSAYPVPPVASEPQQHIRLQSPPHRLNHRNRNLHHGQQYETGTTRRTVK
jgi:hypothetical protein